MPLRPLTDEDRARFVPIADEPPRRAYAAPEATTAQSAVGRVVGQVVGAAQEERRPRLRPMTSDDATRFEPVIGLHAPQEDAAGRGLGAFIAESFTPAPAQSGDATAFLRELRRTSPEQAAAEAAVREATQEFGSRFDAVRRDQVQYNVPETLQRGAGAEADAEGDRRAAHAAGFEGREFWNQNTPIIDGGNDTINASIARILPPQLQAAIADIGGAVVGSAQDPTSWLGGGETLAQKITSNVLWNAGIDVATQTADTMSGAQEGGYDPLRTFAAAGAGAVLPTIAHSLSEPRPTTPRSALIPQNMRAPEEDVTARASRGADTAESEATRLAYEDAGNRARAALRARGINPNTPEYRTAFEAERTAQMQQRPAPAEAAPADAAAKARAELQAEGITPRANEDYADQLAARVQKIEAEQAPEARQARADAEARTQAAFDAALQADPQTRVRTTSRGLVSYVRDTGRRARGRIIVEEVQLDPETGALRPVREIKVLPGELRDLERTKAPSPADAAARSIIDNERDTNAIDTLPEDTVRSALMDDPARKLRSPEDQQIVRDAAERGPDPDAAQNYRNSVTPPREGEGRADVDVEAAAAEMRTRVFNEERKKMIGEAIERIDERQKDAPHLTDISDAEADGMIARRDELMAAGLSKFEADMQASREFARSKPDGRPQADPVSRETGFTNFDDTATKAPSPGEGTRTAPNSGARFIATQTVDVPMPKEPPVAEPAPKKPATGAVPMAAEAPRPPSVRDVVADVGGRISRRDPAKPDEVGDVVKFETKGEAETARDGLRAVYDSAGKELAIEYDTGGFQLRAVPKAPDGGAPRAGPVQRPKADVETPPARAEPTPEVAEVKKAVSDISTELTGLARTLREMRTEMDAKVERAQNQQFEQPKPPAADTGGRQRRVGMAQPSEMQRTPTGDEPSPVERSATERRKAGAEANRTFESEAFGRTSPVDDIPNWRHDVTPDKFARDYLDEVGRPTDIDRFAGVVKSGNRASAVLDADGSMRTTGVGVQWVRAFARRAGIDAPTSAILRATGTADVYGHGKTVYIRVPDEATDQLINAAMKTARAIHHNDPDLEIRLEIHRPNGDPQVAVGWTAAKRSLDALASRDYRGPASEGAGSFRFMDPTYWGRQFGGALEHARHTMTELLGKAHLLPAEDIPAKMKGRDPAAVVVDGKGRAYDTGVGESTYWFAKFRTLARLQRRPEVLKVGDTGRGRQVPGLLENDVLNATRVAVIETLGGEKIEIRMPARLDGPAAQTLRAAVDAMPPDGVRARVFDTNGNSPRVEGREGVLGAIDRAEQAAKDADQARGEVLGAMPFLDPAMWNKHIIQPAHRAMIRYVNSFHQSDPDRVAFWRELGETMNQPPQSGKRSIGAARAVQNLHDTMVVSDIGALRGLKRRYNDIAMSAEDAKKAGDPSMEGRNPIEWMADQVGTEPGSGRVVPRAYEQEVAQDTKRFMRRIDNIMRTMEQATGRLDAAGHKTLAEIVTGQAPSGRVTPEMQAAAKQIRHAFDDEWDASEQAGMSLGNRKNYLMRNFDEDRVVNDPNGFIAAARDQWVDEGVDPAEALTKAQALWTNIAIPSSRRLRVNNEAAGTPNPIAARQWSASADARMRPWYGNDIRKLAPSYIRRIATKRAYTRRFGQQGERLQAAFDAINRQVTREADRDLIRRHMNSALGQGTEHGSMPMTVSGALSWLQVLGVTKFLARTFLLQWAEPMNAAMRENKGAARALQHMVDATRYLFDNSPKAQAERQLANVIGLTGSAAKEMYLDARLNGLVGNLPRRFINNVFDAYGITGMTERQRVYTMRVGERALREALDDVVANGPTRQASESLLGEYGIAAADAPALQKWLRGLDNLPFDDRLDAIGYGEFPSARAWRGALHDFAVKAILEPTAADTPMFAKHPWMRMAYSLSSFQHTFTRETLMRMAVQTKRAVMDRTLSPESAAHLMAVAPAFVALASAQILIQTLRAGVFSSQASNEQTPLEKGITNLSRTGVFGIYDTAINALSSNLRYERDPAGLSAGPFLGDNLSSLFEMIQGLPMAPSNSENTNTAEWQGNKELWSTIIAPTATGLAAQVPLPGPLNLARVGGSAYATSSDASRSFATTMAGERFADEVGGTETFDGGADDLESLEAFE